jgi:peptide/nickel transport system permease protein
MTATPLQTAYPPDARAGTHARPIRRLPPTLLVGSAILAVYVLVAVTARFWAPYDYAQIGTGTPFSQSSAQHPFGVDQLSRDVFSRVVLGTDKELFLALASTFIAMVLGGGLGLLSGFVGGWFDETVTRLIDLFISIPILIFALLVITAAGPELSGSLILLMIVVSLVYMPRIARMARAVAIDLATRDFVTIARTRGEPVWSIVWREFAPNATGVLLVEFGVRAGWAPVLIGTLGFLGFGVRPPTPEWGVMISENRNAIVVAPVVVLAPMLALSFLVMGLNFFTDGLARVLGRSAQRGPM